MRQYDGGHHRCLLGVEDRPAGIQDRSRKGLQPLHRPNHPWLHEVSVRVTVADTGKSMGLAYAEWCGILRWEESQLRE